MMCVVAAMTTASPIGSTLSAYDTGAFHPGSRRFPGFPTLV